MFRNSSTNIQKAKSRDQLIREIEILRENQIGLLQIVEASVDAIITIDQDDLIVMVNQAASDIFGYSKSDLLDKPITLLFPETTVDKLKFIPNEKEAEPDSKSVHVKIIEGRTAQGIEIPIEISIFDIQVNGTPYFNAVLRNVEKRLEVESNTRHREELFKDVFESMIDVFTRVTNEGIIEMVSPSVHSVFGYYAHEVVGKNIVDFLVRPSDCHELIEMVHRMGYCKSFHIEICHKSGEIVIASINAKIYKDQKGNPIGIESISRDITIQKIAKDRLQASAHLLEDSQRIAHIGYCNWNLSTNATEWSDELFRIYGVHMEEKPSHELILSIVHPEDLEHVKENIFLSIKQIKDYDITYRIIREDNGKMAWVQARGKLIFNEKGNPISLLTTVLDITKKKQDEAALLQSEEEFRSIYENSYSGLPIVDLEGKFIRVNRRFMEMLGYSREELRDMTIEQIIHPDDVSKARSELNKLILGRKRHLELEIRYITKSGDELICHTAIGAPIGIDNKPMLLTASLTNITGQKKAQEVLKAISEIQKAFIDEENVSQSFDKMLELVLSITNSEYGFIGEVLSDHRHKPYLKAHAITDVSWDAETSDFCKQHASKGMKFKRLESLFDEVVKAGKRVISNAPKKMTDDRSEDKEPTADNVLCVPFFYGNEMIGMIGVSNSTRAYHQQDIDVLTPFLSTCSTLINAYKNIIQKNNARRVSEELKEAFTNELEQKVTERTRDLELTQEQLSMSLNKEKKLGELKSRFVAIASHQFRTPLTVIQSSMGVLSIQKNMMGKDMLPVFESTYARIKKEIARMTTLMDDALVLSKINAGSVKPVFKATDLVVLCEEVAENYNGIQEDQRQMILEVEGEPYALNLDAVLMSHAISNLVSNAFKYSIERESPLLKIHFQKELVQVIIVDKGIGMPAEEVEFFFEPFYRGSNVREISGTGLGTAITKEYVELNHGTISVTSELTKGTKVVIEFKI